MEIWKDITGYEDLYQVSNKGNVKSMRRDKLLKPSVDKSGHHYVVLRKDGKNKTMSVHILVAKAFIPNPDGLKEVHHKDGNNLRTGDGCDDSVENLEWGAPKVKMPKVAKPKEVYDKVCPWCGRSFKTTSGLKRYCCDQCKQAYYYHIAKVNNPYYKQIQENYERITKAGGYYKV